MTILELLNKLFQHMLILQICSKGKTVQCHGNKNKVVVWKRQNISKFYHIFLYQAFL